MRDLSPRGGIPDTALRLLVRPSESEPQLLGGCGRERTELTSDAVAWGWALLGLGTVGVVSFGIYLLS